VLYDIFHLSPHLDSGFTKQNKHKHAHTLSLDNKSPRGSLG